MSLATVIDITTREPISSEDRIDLKWEAQPGKVLLRISVEGVETEVVVFDPTEADWQAEEARAAAEMARFLGKAVGRG